MSSVLLNSSTMQSLREFRKYDKESAENTKIIGSGKQVHSGKDNAAYYAAGQMSEKQSSALKALHESMALVKNSISVSRNAAEKIYNLSEDLQSKVALATSLGESGNGADIAEIQKNIDGLLSNMKATIDVASFNGDTFFGTGNKSIITGFKTGNNGTTTPITVEIQEADLLGIYNNFSTLDLNTAFTAGTLEDELQKAQTFTNDANDAANKLGIAEKTVEQHKDMLKPISDIISEGASKLISANMEKEAARKAALNVQLQLATQNISLTGDRPDNLLTLLEN